MKPIVHNGQVYPIDHLAPMMLACPCEAAGRDLAVQVSFANHAYTMGYDPEVHAREEILLYEGGRDKGRKRPRVFDPTRHALSFKLPAIVGGFPAIRVHQTAERRNYVYAVPLEIEGQMYEVYFQLQKANEAGLDLRLTVESAYPVASPTVLPRRPYAIRFTVLAYKVFTGQPVRFQAR